jgi:hypothetical protein
MKTKTRKKPRAKAQRRRGKRPEVNGVGVYVTGVRKISVARTALVKAWVLLVLDAKRNFWHAGYRVDLPDRRRTSPPRADGVDFGDKSQAIADTCRDIRGLIEAEARYGTATKKLHCRKAMDQVAGYVGSLAPARARRNGKKGATKTQGRRPKTLSRAEGRGRKAEGNRGPAAATGKNGNAGPDLRVSSLMRRQAAAGDPSEFAAALDVKKVRADAAHAGPSSDAPPEPRSLAAVLDAPAGVMSISEQETLHACEETIRQNLSGFLEVGNALLTIQRGRLYRAKHERFEDYCRSEWDFGKSYAHKLINGAQVVKQLEESPIVPAGKNGKRTDLPEGHLVLPETESQVRPLTRLADPKARIKAWRQAVESAPRGADNRARVTAEIVEQAVAKMLPPKPRAAEEPRAEPQGRGEKAEASGTLTPAEYVRVTRAITAEIETLCRHAGRRMRDEIARFLHNLAAGVEEATLKARG